MSGVLPSNTFAGIDPIVYISSTCSLVGQTCQLPQEADPLLCVEGPTIKRNVYSFLGIPYAEPPIGPKRFKDPEPFPLWDGPRAAKEFGPVGYQDFAILDMIPFIVERPTTISEDCLFLNVWTPTLCRDAKLPVMVWIYGGGFTSGFTNCYRGDALTTFHDVIFVAMAYRIGLPGFLCTGDSAAPGNYGMLDQIEALRWVNKYIANFGGDPSNVTIFGESAGGMSVSFLMMSPLSRGLFKNAICESGTSNTMGDDLSQQTLATSLKQLLDHLKCTATTGEDIVSFLRELPAEQLLLPRVLSANMTIHPVIDGRCLVSSSAEAYANGHIAPVNYIIGINKDEGYLCLNVLTRLGVDLSALGSQMVLGVIQQYVKMTFGGRDITAVVDAIIKDYFGGAISEVAEENQRILAELLGDMVFTAPAVLFADRHAAIGKVYLYTFNQRCAFVKEPDWLCADHAMEIPSVFGLPFIDTSIPFSAEDKVLSHKMMAYWTNFATSGNPNGDGLPEWPAYNSDTKQHLILETNIKQSSNLKENFVNFWNIKVPSLLV